MKQLIIFALFTLLSIAAISQDKVTLTTGKVIRGKITLITNTQINISSPSRDYECPIYQVASYETGGNVKLTDKSKLNQSSVMAEILGNELSKTSRAFAAGAVLSAGGFILTTMPDQFIKIRSGDTEKEISSKTKKLKNLKYI
ncbi:MAG TPA: hypothetical protein PKH58_01440 [Paludibacteraceae bacterium]|nr:hypothetical protein [Paludibacteraceae bacterium]